MDVRDLPALYNQCAAALSISLTSSSLFPFEVMSCGVQPVVNDADNTRVALENNPHIDFVPFRWLLKRSALLVHHGGVGSMSQAFAAGVPQVIMPMGFDQFDNAARVERLGVGRSLPPRRFRGPLLAETIRSLLTDPTVAARCHAAAARLADDDGLGRACDEIEAAWADRHGGSPGVFTAS
jgi:UDP:flavonoid glycosyltransferase YjiC (YdhE family)